MGATITEALTFIFQSSAVAVVASDMAGGANTKDRFVADDEH